MKKRTKLIVTMLLVLLEIVFLSWAIASTRPRRSAEFAVFTSFQHAPTAEDRARLLKEQRVSAEKAVHRKYTAYSLAVVNLIAILFLLSRKPAAEK